MTEEQPTSPVPRRAGAQPRSARHPDFILLEHLLGPGAKRR